MSELEDELRQRLLQAYQTRRPSEGERARMLSSLQAATAAGGAAAALASSGHGTAKSFLLAHFLALPGIGLGVAGAVVLGIWLTRAPPAPSARLLCPAPCRSVPAAAPIAAPPLADPMPPLASGSANAPAAAPNGEAPPAPSVAVARRRRPTPESDDLATEAALLHRAHGAYRRGQPAEALALLEEHVNRYPRSQLSVERRTLKVLALCSLQRTHEARRTAATLPAGSAALRGTCAER